MPKPDFSDVTSVAMARDRADKGELVKVLAFPAEVGGQDVPENSVYLPPAVVVARDRIVGTIVRFAQDGLLTNLEVKPDYKGKSVVPSRITYHATGKKTGDMDMVLEVW